MKTIAIYPGHFQPATKAHYEVYRKLRRLVGQDVFIAITSGEPTEQAPLNFGEKEMVWVRHGVPASHIIKVRDWKNPTEIYEKFSKSNTSVIFALNQRELEEISPRTKKASQIKEEEEPTSSPQDPNQTIWVGTDNKPSYFQPYEGNENNMEPLVKHAYAVEIDDSHIGGRPFSTANIRQGLGSPRYTDDQKKKFFRMIFGWFDIGLYNMMTFKFKMAHQVASPDETPAVDSPSTIVGAPKAPPVSGKEQLRNMVRECLKELMEGSLDGGEEIDTSLSMSDTLDSEKSDAEKRSEQNKKQADLVKQKKELEAKAKQNKQQRDNYFTTVKNYDNFQKKNDRDALDATTKQIAQSKSMPAL